MSDELMERFSEVLKKFGDDDHKQVVLQAAYSKVVNEAAQLIADKLMAPDWQPPAREDSITLEELMAQEDMEVEWLVDGLLGKGFNHVVTAQYKTGKSLLAMNLAASLVDGFDFLGEFATPRLERRVGIWNAEMMKASFRSYISKLKIENTGKVMTAHLRGMSVDILNDEQAVEWATGWLRDNDVEVWVIDTWGRLCAWCGVSENKNDEVGLLLQRIDEIKKAAGVSTVVITSHTGRSEQDEGKERSRGATVLDDWVDVRFVYTKVQRVNGVSPRFLHGEGREVSVDEFKVVLDEESGRLRKDGAVSRKQDRLNAAAQQVRQIVEMNPGATSSVVRAEITAVGDANAKTQAMDLAVAQGLVRREGSSKVGATMKWYPTTNIPSWAKTVEVPDEQ